MILLEMVLVLSSTSSPSGVFHLSPTFWPRLQRKRSRSLQAFSSPRTQQKWLVSTCIILWALQHWRFMALGGSWITFDVAGESLLCEQIWPLERIDLVSFKIWLHCTRLTLFCVCCLTWLTNILHCQHIRAKQSMQSADSTDFNLIHCQPLLPHVLGPCGCPKSG